MGVVVFEVYGAFVDTFIPVHALSNSIDENLQTRTAATKRSWSLQALPSNNKLPESVIINTLGGFLGGSAHGVVATLWDSIFDKMHQQFPISRSNVWNLRPNLALVRQQLPGMIAHHGLSHAVLFGSYELSKRLILSSWASNTKCTLHDVRIVDDEHDVNIMHQQHMVHVEYLAYIFVAGGISGQAQHIASHFTDKLFLSHSISTSLPLRALLLPLAISFFPSGIAFVALEYSKVR